MIHKELTEMDIAVVREFAENDMNYSATARVMYLHPNGVRYHLERAYRKTGLDPTRFYDLVELLDKLREVAEDD